MTETPKKNHVESRKASRPSARRFPSSRTRPMQPILSPCPFPRVPSGLVRTPRVLGRADPEAVLELARDAAEGPQAAGAGRLSPLGLLAPVVCPGDISTASLGAHGYLGSDVHFRVFAAGYPQPEHVFFWMCIERRPSSTRSASVRPAAGWPFSVASVDSPQRRHSVCVLLCRLPKLEVPFAVAVVSCHPHVRQEGALRRGVLIVSAGLRGFN